MFPGKKTILLAVSLLLPTYSTSQTSEPNPATTPLTRRVTDSRSPNQAITIAELQAPKAILLARLAKEFRGRTKTFGQPVLAPKKPSLNAMFMWSGTQNFVAKFTDNSGTLGNSDIFDINGHVGIGKTNPQEALDVTGGRILSHNTVVIGLDNSLGATLFVNGPMIAQFQQSLLYGTQACCSTGVGTTTGSSLGSTAGTSSSNNGAFFNSNGTADGDGNVGAQINTALPSWRMALGSGTAEWPGGDNFAIGRVAAGGTYSSPSILFSIANNGRMKVAGGVDNGGSGLKHVRASGCTILAGGLFCSVTINWSGTFADANYTLTCMIQNGEIPSFSNKTSSGVTIGASLASVSTVNQPTGEIDCIAMHD